MYKHNKTQMRRSKVECMSCKSVFNLEYKQTHEQKMHGGQHIQVKVIGAPKNPFEAAKRQKTDHCPEVRRRNA